MARPRFPETLTARMEPQADGCVHFTGCVDRDGYGQIKVAGKQMKAHRAAYEHFIGPIPDGHTLDHTCHDPAACPGGPACLHRRCVEPAHLEPVSPTENVRRGGSITSTNAAKTHCVNGHPFDEVNTGWARGRRYCKECNRTRARERWRRLHPESERRF